MLSSLLVVGIVNVVFGWVDSVIKVLTLLVEVTLKAREHEFILTPASKVEP